MTSSVEPSIKLSETATLETNKAHLHEIIVSPANLHEQEQQAQPQNDGKVDPDELARSAGQLLDSVSQETSDKFANSSFLALMRSLRDREVVVQGENFINSSTNAIANTTGVATEAIEEPESLISTPPHIAMLDSNQDAVGEY